LPAAYGEDECLSTIVAVQTPAEDELGGDKGVDSGMHEGWHGEPMVTSEGAIKTVFRSTEPASIGARSQQLSYYLIALVAMNV